MAITLQLNPELESRLSSRAHSQGQSLEVFIQQLLELELAEATPGDSQSSTGAEKARAFRQWAESFPPSMPLLNLESISREAIYRQED